MPADDLTIGHWTRVEFASMLAREIRMNSLDAGTAREAASRFEAMSGESLIVLLPNRDDFDCARDGLGQFEAGPRVGDERHLAITSNPRAEAIYNLDKLIIAAETTLGLPARAGVVFPGYDP